MSLYMEGFWSKFWTCLVLALTFNTIEYISLISIDRSALVQY